MSDIKLGPLGSEIVLPPPCWPQGSAPEIPYNIDKGVEEAKMSDGSSRFNVPEHASGSFTLDWDGLLWSEVQKILEVVVSNQALSYINEWTDGVSHKVVVLTFGYALKAATAARTAKYTFSLTMKETKAP